MFFFLVMIFVLLATSARHLLETTEIMVLVSPVCRNCGYDLVGIAENSCCPECGDTRSPKSAETRAVRTPWNRERTIEMICAGLTPLAWALSYELFPFVARSVLVLQMVATGFGSYAASRWASANAAFASRSDVMATGLLLFAVSTGCVFLTSRIQRLVVPWCCVAAAWAVALVLVLRTP